MLLLLLRFLYAVYASKSIVSDVELDLLLLRLEPGIGCAPVAYCWSHIVVLSSFRQFAIMFFFSSCL